METKQSSRKRRTAAKHPASHEQAIVDILRRVYGNAECELNHKNAYELMVAAILSAQSTATLVNRVTATLFARYPNAAALAEADPRELEEMVRPTGFQRRKATALRYMAQAVVARHHGEIPGSMRALRRLPGVDRTIAQLILTIGFGIPAGIAIDAHVSRVSQRLGLTTEERAVPIERDLMKLTAKSHWVDLGSQLSWHGQRICHAQRPACRSCPLVELCPSAERYLNPPPGEE